MIRSVDLNLELLPTVRSSISF